MGGQGKIDGAGVAFILMERKRDPNIMTSVRTANYFPNGKTLIMWLLL